MLNGILQVATMIELGHVRAGLVVGSEGGRELVETTIDVLNRDETLTRDTIKPAFASLTIGSASCAILLVDRELSETGNQMIAASVHANTDQHQLCRSGRDESVAEGMQPLMSTDSERLMREGIATGVETFSRFLDRAGWSRDQVSKTFCHQVGAAHRKLMLAALGIEPSKDYTTLEWLGNTGSVALPITLAIGNENGHLESNDNVAMLGIGSGINCVMLAVRWQKQSTNAKRVRASGIPARHF